MNAIRSLLDSHPRKPDKDLDALTSCIQECFRCADLCTACADACLGEEMVKDFVRCIRLNLDCADVCAATGRILSRLTEPDGAILKAQLQACEAACRVCGAECKKHAQMHAHCKVCAEGCAKCLKACEALLATYR